MASHEAIVYLNSIQNSCSSLPKTFSIFNLLLVWHHPWPQMVAELMIEIYPHFFEIIVGVEGIMLPVTDDRF